MGRRGSSVPNILELLSSLRRVGNVAYRWYVETEVDENRAKAHKLKIELAEPLPYLYQSFPMCEKPITDGLVMEFEIFLKNITLS